jgi:hypothetical protein
MFPKDSLKPEDVRRSAGWVWRGSLGHPHDLTPVVNPEGASPLVPPSVGKAGNTPFRQTKGRQIRWMPKPQVSRPYGSRVEVSAEPTTWPISVGKDARLFGPPRLPRSIFRPCPTGWRVFLGKRPRSSRLCCPDCGDGWFGGITSTRTAALRIGLRNSVGSESRDSSVVGYFGT